MIDAIAALDPALRLQHRFLQKGCDAPEILRQVDAYLDAYCEANGITPAQAQASIAKFTTRYQSDLADFAKTGRYPKDRPPDGFRLSRVEYDLFLIASMLFTRHRFAIAKFLAAQQRASRRRAFIGVGSGIELALVPAAPGKTEAFDLSVPDFARRWFPQVVFHEQPFGGPPAVYDTVYAIEMLEHVDFPERLVQDIHLNLAEGGVLVCSIAHNVPQFDHTVNMSGTEFEKNVGAFFEIKGKCIVQHAYRMTKVDAHNILYVLKKK